MSVTYSSPWCDVFDIIVSGKGCRWSTPTRWSLYNIMRKKIVDNRLLSVMLCRRYYLIWYRLSVTDSCQVKTIQSNVNKMSITDSKSGWDVIGTILRKMVSKPMQSYFITVVDDWLHPGVRCSQFLQFRN